MDSPLLPVFVGLFMVGFVVLIIWIGARETERVWRRVEQLAGRLELAMEPANITFGRFYGAPRANGLKRGKRVEIYTFSTGSGKSRVRWAAIAVTPRATGGLTFALTRQGFGTKVLEFFGTKEIQVGDPVFDRACFVQTNQPEFFGAALLPELRGQLAPAMAQGRSSSFKLETGRVVYAEVGYFDDACCKRLENATGIACDLADVAEVFAESGKRA
jgi:hypothetical protein